MFIAHLPASYLLTRALRERSAEAPFWAGGLGSLLPDLDLFYFYLIDGRRHHHHSYWTHLPIYWLAILALSLAAAWAARARRLWAIGWLFFPNVFLHLALDSIVGEIAWLFPLSEQRFALFEVPARYDFWVWSFIFHWSFLLEIALCLAAAGVLIRSQRLVKTQPKSARVER